MKHRDDHDEAIDRILAGLREAKPLEGMEQRVLRAAQERADTRRRWSLQLPFLATRSWAVAAASVAVIALAASWKIATIARNRRTVHEIAHIPAQLSPKNAPEVKTYLAAAQSHGLRPAHEARHAFAAEHNAPPEALDDEDALAMSEMLAPSKPAPPLPLTHQETMLAEVVHHGAPEELASLRPDVRAREVEIAKAEFHDFFEPPSLNPSPVKTTNKAEQVQN